MRVSKLVMDSMTSQGCFHDNVWPVESGCNCLATKTSKKIIGDGPRFISPYPVFLRIIKKGVSFVFLKIVFQVAKVCHVYHLKRHG